jgi:hypothetical protein
MSALFYALHQELASAGIAHKSLWVIERKKSPELPWKLSVGFPMSMTHSALDFFVHERERIRGADLPIFEGMRLVLMTGGTRIDIAGVQTSSPRP